jgi:transcriptional antiterminator RfaH
MAMPDSGRRWYVVQTARYREQITSRAINGLKFETYLPCETKWHRRKRRAIRYPLFPRYLFAHFDVGNDQWWQIERIGFVARIVRNASGKPRSVRDHEIEALRQAERLGFYDHTRRVAPEERAIPIGSKVRIMTGPFVGLVAEVRRASPRRRIEILFSMLGRQTVAQVERKHLSVM